MPSLTNQGNCIHIHFPLIATCHNYVTWHKCLMWYLRLSRYVSLKKFVCQLQIYWAIQAFGMVSCLILASNIPSPFFRLLPIQYKGLKGRKPSRLLLLFFGIYINAFQRWKQAAFLGLWRVARIPEIIEKGEEKECGGTIWCSTTLLQM